MCGQRHELLGAGSVCQVGKEQRECLRCKLRPFQHRRLHSRCTPVVCVFGGFIFWWWLFLQMRQRREIYSAHRALGTPSLSQVQAWTCFGGKKSRSAQVPAPATWEGDAFLALLLRCGRWLRRGRRAKPKGLSWQDSALSILAGFQGFYLLQLGKTLRSPNSCLMGK